MQKISKGFYYHYKHDPAGPVNHYAYEVLGVGKHSEDDCRPEDRLMVIYRPLYQSDYFTGADASLRPLEMFLGEVVKDGKKFARFAVITDEKSISELKKIRDEMYSA